jgi:FtsZ-interacting cell division protein ZipA
LLLVVFGIISEFVCVLSGRGLYSNSDEEEKKKKKKKRKERNMALEEDDYDLLEENNVSGFKRPVQVRDPRPWNPYGCPSDNTKSRK